MTRPVHLCLSLLVVFLALSAFYMGGVRADVFKKKEKLALAFLAGMVLGQQGRNGGGGYPIPVPWPMQGGQQVLPLPLPIPIGGGYHGGGGHAAA